MHTLWKGAFQGRTAGRAAWQKPILQASKDEDQLVAHSLSKVSGGCAAPEIELTGVLHDHRI